MKSYFFQTPLWIQWAYSDLIWKMDTDEKVLFLTFDDGPVPEATPYVLDCLAEHAAKGTFFCLGAQVSKNPELFSRILREHHQVGNHSYSHLNGWQSPDEVYFENIEQCDQQLQECGASTRLLRPPYGKISRTQINALKKKYNIMMWSHLSGDFDPFLDVKASLRSLLKAGSGSILVFHDSAKALKNLKQTLPVVLDHFSTLGFTFKPLSDDAVG